jgi:hypothetical protein
VECVSTILDVTLNSHRHPTGPPAVYPDGYGLGMRMDGQELLCRQSHPPEVLSGTNTHAMMNTGSVMSAVTH